MFASSLNPRELSSWKTTNNYVSLLWIYNHFSLNILVFLWPFSCHALHNVPLTWFFKININRYILLHLDCIALWDSQRPTVLQLMKNVTFIFTWSMYVIGVATWLMHGIKRPQGDITSHGDVLLDWCAWSSFYKLILQ